MGESTGSRLTEVSLMLLSTDYTSLRTAVLTEDVIESLRERYSGIKGTESHKVLDELPQINRMLSQLIPGKEDLVTEWILKNLVAGNGLFPDSWDDFVAAATFFFKNYKDPTFKEAVKEYSEDIGKQINPKNLLDFGLYNFEDVQSILQELTEGEKDLPRKLPDGSSMFYNDGSYQIVEVTGKDAACILGRGSRWCTKKRSTSGAYLEEGPLYILYKGGDKVAQIHITKKSVELMDLENKPAAVEDEGLRQALINSGLMNLVLKHISVDLSEYTFQKFLGRKPSPYLDEVCSKDPGLAYLYAGIMGHRFPEGEPAIIQDTQLLFWYAQYIIQGRFLEAEPLIMQSDELIQDYLSLLRKVSRIGYSEFWKLVNDYGKKRVE